MLGACKLLRAELCPVEKRPSATTLSTRIVSFQHFKLVFVHTTYTSSMAACYYNYVHDVTVPQRRFKYKRCDVRDID